MRICPNLAVVGLISLAAIVHGTAAEVVLTEAGVAKLPIVAAEDSTAADALAGYLEKISGAEFARQKELRGHGIFVGTASRLPSSTRTRLGIDENFGVEEILVHSSGGSLYLVGGSEKGVSHAVFTFLRELGCRWYFPGELWEELPRNTSIRGAWDIREKPDFSLGRRIWYGFGAYPKNRRDLELWNRQNRMGGRGELRIGHTWAGLKPERDFAEHPEWFALVDGKRSHAKPCYSHPEVVKRMTEYALAAAASGRKCVSVSAPDGLGFCECARCRDVFKGAKPYDAHRTLFAKRPNGPVVNITSETLFRAVNTAAKAVAEKHLDVTIACYAYSAYSHPPSFDLHPNVYIQTTTAFRRTPLESNEQLAQFGAKAKRLGVREYYSVFQWDWDWPHPGKTSPEQLAKDLRFFHANGVDAINAEASNNWAARGLGYYIAAQLLWDVDAKTKPLLADFYTRAFGPAARAMERYFVRWYGMSAAVSDHPELPEQVPPFEKKIDLDAMRGAFRDLDAATVATPASSRYRARVDAFRSYLHYLLLRHRLELAGKSGDKDAIIAAIRAETEFGGRLNDTNLIHSRALIGKAFLRRFRDYASLLEQVDTSPWRVVGTPPDAAEIDRLWEADRVLLGE